MAIRVRLSSLNGLKIASVSVLCAAFVLMPIMLAQGTADIVGTVTDNSGAVVAGARVTAKNLGTSLSRSVETTTSGDYTFSLCRSTIIR